mmetsp:Transcript_15270/g.41016  ORF Transcript_15270/g.41016 Transcript_15270/m.41016 type:complete len:278 (-) Transcript_15270:526-1359(-)
MTIPNFDCLHIRRRRSIKMGKLGPQRGRHLSSDRSRATQRHRERNYATSDYHRQFDIAAASWRSSNSLRVALAGLLLAKHHLVEAVDLVGGANAERSALVDARDLHVEHGAASDTIRRLATCLLNKERKGSGLESKAELRGRVLGGWVGEDALLLGELLVHVGHEAAGVAEGVAVLHPVVEEALVAGEVLGRAHVGGREDLGVLADLDLGAGRDPLVALTESELVGAVIECDKDGSAGAIEGNEGGDLVTASRAQKASLLAPDADHGANSPVVVHDG